MLKKQIINLKTVVKLIYWHHLVTSYSRRAF